MVRQSSSSSKPPISSPPNIWSVSLYHHIPRYAVYHRKDGLKKIAARVHGLAQLFAKEAQAAGLTLASTTAFFDTVLGQEVGPGQIASKRWLDRVEMTCFDFQMERRDGGQRHKGYKERVKEQLGLESETSWEAFNLKFHYTPGFGMIMAIFFNQTAVGWCPHVGIEVSFETSKAKAIAQASGETKVRRMSWRNHVWIILTRWFLDVSEMIVWISGLQCFGFSNFTFSCRWCCGVGCVNFVTTRKESWAES